MPNTNERDALPCPFCGSADISDGEVLSEHPGGKVITQSMCRGCAALGPEARLACDEIDYGSTKAIAAWNRRAATAPNAGATNNAIPKSNPLSAGKCLHGVSMADHCQSCVGKVAAPNAGAPLADMPALQRRRAYDDSSESSGHLESDRDFMQNNQDLVLWYLEHDAAIRAALDAAPALSDEAATAIHRVPYVRDCLSAYRGRPADPEAVDLVKAIAAQLSHLAAAPAQQAGAPLTLTEEQREDVLDALRNTHGLAGDVEEMLDAVLEEVAAARAPLPLAPSDAVGKYGNVLRPFFALMERELHANSSKGDRPGWLSMTRDRALLEIYYHVSKLSVAMKNDDAPAIAEHSADVANMAMMALDVCGGLATRAQPQADAAEPVAKNSARYLWLRENCYDHDPAGDGDAFPCVSLHFESDRLEAHSVESLDEAIDAQIAAQAPGARGEQA